MTREEQILSLRKSVEVLASQYARTTPLPYDEFVSAGWVAAIRAVDHFDPARGVKLSSYAEHKIRGAMKDLLRSNPVYSSYRSKQGISAQVDLDKTYLESKDTPELSETRIDIETLAAKAQLTPRQYEVLEGLLNGLNLEDISKRDHVQPTAIKNIKDTLMRKMMAAV